MIPAVLAIMMCRVIYLSFINNNAKVLLNLLVMSFCFFISGQLMVVSIAESNRDHMEITETVEYLQTVDSNTPVYFLWNAQGKVDHNKCDNLDTKKRRAADFYQFLLMDQPLILVDIYEFNETTSDKYVLLNEVKYLDQLLNDYELCMSNRYGYLLSSK